MKLNQFVLFLLLSLLFTSCISTKNSIKNIDDSAPTPVLTKKNTFVLTEYSSDKKYGFDATYPINIFYRSTLNDTINAGRFIRALAGPNGEPLIYKRLESCCPFPTKRSDIGAGMLEVFEITWSGNIKPLVLYFNSYEKGKLLIPMGLTLKKEDD
ncbi:2-dehydro-3-deoxyphosphooctonate aldolase [Flavobacterium orientale]|uniref:2-dehydro-3-deoxyphosphooctonate aldolase n=1 Tax=Flavobacterium orientale TaxID=1756020 RepID=A0A916Y9C3_9FLAO|nr:2-dehydro-3-deoxyphosphooctonate aldolase [Flavobacterium orientale]GGD34815.1 2-dehydro-3-deoxyphosphooctonate aldolase [Flavobacterium orientale]